MKFTTLAGLLAAAATSALAAPAEAQAQGVDKRDRACERSTWPPRVIPELSRFTPAIERGGVYTTEDDLFEYHAPSPWKNGLLVIKNLNDNRRMVIEVRHATRDSYTFIVGGSSQCSIVLDLPWIDDYRSVEL